MNSNDKKREIWIYLWYIVETKYLKQYISAFNLENEYRMGNKCYKHQSAQ